MSDFAEPLARLINEFKRLPGIGQKSAQRIAFHIMRHSRDDANQLAQTILDVKDKLTICLTCNNISDGELCQYCRDPQRDQKVICCVEDPNNVVGIEVTRQFTGLYHVLGGALAPLRGIGPDDLHVTDLLNRIGPERIEEVLLATNPNVEGEATALYLARRLKGPGVKVTRLAFGLPVGAAIEFADEVTLSRSVLGRREI